MPAGYTSEKGSGGKRKLVVKFKAVTRVSNSENTVGMIESGLELNPKVTQLSRHPSHMVGG